MTLRPDRHAFLLAALLSLSPALHAQANTVRTLSGTVTGDDQKPIVGAVVKLENNATKSIISYITEPGGTYTFKGLSSNGDYIVWAAWNGKRSKQKSLDHFNIHQDPRIDLSVGTH